MRIDKLITRAVAIAGLVASADASAQPLRVMSIGDSITAGYTDNPVWNEPFEFGYRAKLYGRLVDAGYEVQMVGESTEPWLSPFAGDPSQGGTYAPDFDLRPIGQDNHRGYGGVAAGFVLNGIRGDDGSPGWLEVDEPDLILLHIGTNGQFTLMLDAVLGEITTRRPGVPVLVAEIIPQINYIGSIDDYNSQVAGRVVPKYQNLGAEVYAVDHYTPFLTTPRDTTSINRALFATVNHPNNIGYDVMAETWFNAIDALFNPAGDFNSDGRVDATDYATWREGLGGDFTPSGLSTWANNYGAASPTAATAVAAPEPACTLLVIALPIATWSPRRQAYGKFWNP